MSTVRKLAFSTSPAQQWIEVTLGMPRRGRRDEQRQCAGARRAAAPSDPHNENPRSTFEQGCRAIKVGRRVGEGDGALQPEDFASGDRGAYERVQTHVARMAGADCSTQSNVSAARGPARPRRVDPQTVGPVQDRKPPPKGEQCATRIVFNTIRVQGYAGMFDLSWWSLLARVVVLDMVENHESRA